MQQFNDLSIEKKKQAREIGHAPLIYSIFDMFDVRNTRNCLSLLMNGSITVTYPI